MVEQRFLEERFARAPWSIDKEDPSTACFETRNNRVEGGRLIIAHHCSLGGALPTLFRLIVLAGRGDLTVTKAIAYFADARQRAQGSFECLGAFFVSPTPRPYADDSSLR